MDGADLPDQPPATMSVLINAYCTVQNPPERTFAHQPLAERDRSDPALAPHLDGLSGYVMKDNRELTQMRYAVLRHVGRVQHHFSFEVEDSALEAMGYWAQQANAIVFLPDGSLRDPSGKMLVDAADGNAAADARVPYPADAMLRKQRNDSWLADNQIPVAPSLPPSLGESELALRDPAAVAERFCALVLVAMRAESVNSGDPISAADMAARFPQAYGAFTERERHFVESDDPERQAVIDHLWRYEAADTLRWALGRTAALPLPSQICDVPAIAGDLVNSGPDEIVSQAALRPPSDILDQADLHLRLHWATRQATIDGTEEPQGLQPGIIAERRHALQWLMRFEDAAWDNVTTPT